MKNKSKIIVLITVIAVVIVAIVGIAIGFNNSDASIIVIDSEGNQIAILKDIDSSSAVCENDDYKAFLDIVIDDAVELVVTTKQCSEEAAKKELLKKEYTIQTTFDKEAFDASKNAYERVNCGKEGFAAVFTTVDGKILSVFSKGRDENINFALEKTQPYSSFKPLSVYAPAIENNVVSWASSYLDSPVKKIKDENGEFRDWPANGNNKYMDKNVGIGDGVKLSLNTTAVRCLQDLGVKNSIDFLKNFNINTKYETEVAALYGDEEVLHNIGMGYLMAGVSPLDMVGYYQIFATGGKYIKPYSVEKIVNDDNEIIYETKPESRRIISEETAYIMNQLLQLPLTGGGTSQKAQYEDLCIAGKTGTGDDYVDNWFVGCTPEYTCSIWHGKNIKNNCAETFAELISGISVDKAKEFPVCTSIKKIPYCQESGGKLTMYCRKMDMGYFKSNTQLEECEIHKR